MPDRDLLDARRSLVLVVDIQGKLVDQVHRPRLLLRASERLLKLAGLFEIPVVLTEQYPKGLGPTHPDVLAAFDALASPKEKIEKTSFGCCGDVAFEAALRRLLPGIEPSARQIVVAGIEAHVCVMQTVVQLLRQGSDVHVCWEAVSGRGEEYRRHALERMRDLGAQITNHESAAFEWARTKDHERFKELSALLKTGQIVD